jgi:hypothetical protein
MGRFDQNTFLVAQAFQPVPAQAEACGYMVLQESPY